MKTHISSPPEKKVWNELPAHPDLCILSLRACPSQRHAITFGQRNRRGKQPTEAQRSQQQFIPAHQAWVRWREHRRRSASEGHRTSGMLGMTPMRQDPAPPPSLKRWVGGEGAGRIATPGEERSIRKDHPPCGWGVPNRQWKKQQQKEEIKSGLYL